ncbi:hypothetical protein HanRHA438_Chr09g0392301 [Helianthus annuus]|nr:hypothetical protein HanRHA438_Chr09g0392301 [Helianthus annuus]
MLAAVLPLRKHVYGSSLPPTPFTLIINLNNSTNTDLNSPPNTNTNTNPNSSSPLTPLTSSLAHHLNQQLTITENHPQILQQTTNLTCSDKGPFELSSSRTRSPVAI